MSSGIDCQIKMFYSKRNLFRLFTREFLEPISELEAIWKTAAVKEIEPYMERAKEMLIKAGIDETQISSLAVDGSHNASSDILKATDLTAVELLLWGTGKPVA